MLNLQAPQLPGTDDASHPIFICLLGHFLLLKAGRPVPLRRGGKTELLLGHLGLQPTHRLPRATLVHRLWPTSESTLASQSLHSLVYSLHKLMGDVLSGYAPVVQEDGCYRLNLEAGVVVDVDRFDTLANVGTQHANAGNLAAASVAYQSAVDLYRGQLCIDSDVEALIARERLRARYLTLLAHLADYYYTMCNYDVCLEYAWYLLTCDPCREDAHRLVMRCHVRQGARAEALHQYHLCVEVLHTEFDAAPEMTTKALFEQIRLDPGSI